jgi:hypothetical protein
VNIIIYFKIIELLDSTLSVSDSTLNNWIKADFTDTEIFPHLSDYCPMCFQFTILLNSFQIQINLQKIYSFNIVSIQLLYQYCINIISLIICTTIFAQPLLRLTKLAKKKKTRKKFLKYPLSETSKDICGSRRHWSCETKHRQNDDIMLAQRFTRWLHNVHVTSAWQKRKKSKNRQKTKKLVFFKFLTRVKSNTCKKWDVGSTYTPL